MDPARDPSSWKLAEGCQRLVRRARAVLFGVRSVAPLATHEAERVVTPAVELLPFAGEKKLPDLAEAAAVPAPFPAKPAAPVAVPVKVDVIVQRLAEEVEIAGVETVPKDLSVVGSSGMHELVLNGRDNVFATPDLIAILSSQKKTGVLEIVTEDETFLLEIQDGDVAHAQSNHTPQGRRLGDILVEMQVLDRATLESARERLPGLRLGAALLETGLVSRDQLLAALQVQIQHLFQRLFESPMTHFSFWSGPPIRADERVRLNATSLLLEGARVSDEKNWHWNTG